MSSSNSEFKNSFTITRDQVIINNAIRTYVATLPCHLWLTAANQRLDFLSHCVHYKQCHKVKTIQVTAQRFQPVLLSEFGKDPSSRREVALFVVILPHQVQHRNVVRLCDNVLLQVWLQVRRLDLHRNTAKHTYHLRHRFMLSMLLLTFAAKQVKFYHHLLHIANPLLLHLPQIHFYCIFDISQVKLRNITVNASHLWASKHIYIYIYIYKVATSVCLCLSSRFLKNVWTDFYETVHGS